MSIKNKEDNSVIFIKKLNKKQKIIPLNIVNNTLNKTRYFPPSIREWYNNIYAYNNNTNILSFFNNNLSTLIKGYFYMYYKDRTFNFRNRSIRLKRLSLKRILIGKMELKHTNSKAIITIYVYNEERRILTIKLLRLISLFLKTNKSLSTDSPIKPLISKLYFIEKHNEQVSILTYLKVIRSILLNKLKDYHNKLFVSEILPDKEKVYVYKILQDLKRINNIIITCSSNVKLCDKYDNIYKGLIRKTNLEKEIKLLLYYKLLLILNKNKFKNLFLSRLTMLVSKLLNKEVEFNIVNQKSAHLNSDIFTEAISIKLRKRKNKLLKTLKNFLKTIKIPKLNKINRNYKLLDKLSFKRINTIFYNYKNNEDILNNLLSNTLSIRHNNSNKKKLINKTVYDSNNNKKVSTLLLNSLSYKQVVGIRLEAKGRLTKRFTASRSVFKVKWKGSIRNIDSSYKGLSSVILRGHLRSNLQYSLVNSTTRNGAFGLKGWMSGN